MLPLFGVIPCGNKLFPTPIRAKRSILVRWRSGRKCICLHFLPKRSEGGKHSATVRKQIVSDTNPSEAKYIGEVAEWLNAHAWKACVPQGTEGSNPSLTATTKEGRHKRVARLFVVGEAGFEKSRARSPS